MNNTQTITPFLWFDHQAEEAANFYCSVFPNSSLESVARNGDTVMVVGFVLNGKKFSALNGGPKHQFNPSVSFFVSCDTPHEVQAVWSKLADGGMVLMPLNKYDWSEQYGWVQDKYGLSWQIMLGKFASTDQKIMPSFLFTGPQRGHGEAAVRFYTQLFPQSAVAMLFPYSANETGPEGSLKYAEFSLAGQTFAAMDNPMAEPAFTFNEAVSFVINCDTQDEVDFFWEKLTADGGEESMCGWLKDQFGVSWQVIPEALLRLLGDPNPAVAQRAMMAMLQMRKIEIARLAAEPADAPKTSITVQSTVNAPVTKIWQLWTEPEHIVQWNNASDDWHTPKAANDLRPGGNFVYTMSAKDGSFRFDFSGKYDDVVENQRITYTIEDGRKVVVLFETNGTSTVITETFEAENLHSHEMQRSGWQAILDNFKKYAEG
ncbi:MAG: VOC family protein [Saprospiraceae bacterium]